MLLFRTVLTISEEWLSTIPLCLKSNSINQFEMIHFHIWHNFFDITENVVFAPNTMTFRNRQRLQIDKTDLISINSEIKPILGTYICNSITNTIPAHSKQNCQL